MCLVTKQICPLRAKRDITVYKILKYNLLGSLNLYTPYTATRVKVGETMDDSNEEIHFSVRSCGNAISKGMIHSYTDELYARIVMTARWDLIYRGVIAECTIPKGTLYYISTHKKTICSKKLRINKIIYRNERKP